MLYLSLFALQLSLRGGIRQPKHPESFREKSVLSLNPKAVPAEVKQRLHKCCDPFLAATYESMPSKYRKVLADAPASLFSSTKARKKETMAERSRMRTSL